MRDLDFAIDRLEELIAALKRARDRETALISALEFTRGLLDDLTTDEFRKGGDKPARDAIDAVLIEATPGTNAG